MSEAAEQSNTLILQVIEQVEKRIQDRENKRFRILYGMIALISFIGIGVFSQLIELYATRAVEQRLESSRLELESAKSYAQLTALATKLDLSDSFTVTDRDTVMQLLAMAAPNKKLRTEPAFKSLLEKIIDSFAVSDNDIFVSRIFDMYEHECLDSAGIAQTLQLHYARRLLSAIDLKSEIFLRDIKRFQNVADAAETFGNKGTTAALRSLVTFQLADEKMTNELTKAMSSYSALTEREKERFVFVIERFSSPNSSEDSGPSPADIRISKISTSFKTAYITELKHMVDIGTPENPNQTAFLK